MKRNRGWGVRRRALMLEGMRNFGWFLLFYGLFSLAASSHTAPDVAGLTKWAAKLTGYPEPDKLPIVHFVPRSTLDEMLGREGGGGAYLGGRVVYISQEEPPKEQDAILLHEITHYLQMLAGKHRPELRCGRELESARAEWSYRAIAHGESKDFSFNWEWYSCKPSEL